MDPKIAKVIENINAHAKPSQPWNRGQPVNQKYFVWQDDEWKGLNRSSAQAQPLKDGSAFSIMSWNIDFMRSFTQQRMKVALEFLRKYVSQVPGPTIVMLNEMLVSDLELIQAQEWVRDQYVLTDVSNEYWESGYYGTCVLIPNSLHIRKIFRVHYPETAMDRDGLFCDIRVVGEKYLRICSTHLESLVAEPPKRPSQLATAAGYMHQAHASVLGGDLNAIQPFDKTLHVDNKLKDAYLEQGGMEDDEEGMTWGQMAATRERTRFGLSRMDKLLFCGALQLEKFKTFGHDVQLEDGDLAKRLMMEDGLERPWVTDHLGVFATFRLT